MSNNPTVAQLVNLATSIANTLTEEQARIFIRAHKIRSNGKLKTLVQEHFIDSNANSNDGVVEMTNEENVVKVDEKSTNAEVVTTEVLQEEPKVEEVVEEVKASEQVEEPKVEEKPKVAKKEKVAKEITPVQPGPRGFRFGPTWNASVKSGAGIALMEVNRNKLIAQAVALEIEQSIIDKGDAVEIAKAIAEKLEV